jgi:hypothetical protein
MNRGKLHKLLQNHSDQLEIINNFIIELRHSSDHTEVFKMETCFIPTGEGRHCRVYLMTLVEDGVV